MRHKQPLAGAFVLLLALGAGRAGEEVETAPRAECTYDPAQIHSTRELAHLLSVSAEAVAPSSATSRRRVVLPPTQWTYSPKNFVDDAIFGKMVRDHVAWTGRSTDEQFLRRVSLDLTGQIPTSDQVKAFVNDPMPDKRDRMIDQLLGSDGFVDRWTIWYGDLVQNVQTSANFRETYQGRNAFYNWIRQSLQSGKPYDQMVRETLSSTGGAFTVGPVNYWVRNIQTNGPIQDTYDNMSSSSGSQFLGLPLICTSCHDGAHHLETVNPSLATRTRYDFWKNAAFFAQESTTNAKDPATNNVEITLADNATGSYRLNTTSGNKTPRQPAAGQPAMVDPLFYLSGEAPKANEPRRQAYARILTANPQFARAAVNYIWKELFGIGIVEPADSFDLIHQDTQPTHPQLLTDLANYFVSHNYDLRALVRVIVQSNAYQLSDTYSPGNWNETFTTYYARHYPRRLLAEAILDEIGRATNVPPSFTVQGLGQMQRAMALPDPTEPGARTTYGPILNAFGRGDRDTTARTRDGSIVQALHMLNDAIVTTRVKSSTANTTVAHVLAASKDPGTIADELYLATLSRRPSSSERTAAINYLNSGTLAQKAEDLQYALMNRLEFLFN